MKLIRTVLPLILLSFVPVRSPAQQKVALGDNAALRYWSAFAQMRDFAMTDEQAKETNLILEGTAPYDDSKYRDLLEKNQFALKVMARGTNIARCDWGLDYQLGPATPVDYVRKSLALGRLNVLYALHQLITGDQDGAARTLAAGLRFSRDVASDGTLFATLAAKSLIIEHLGVIAFAMHSHGLSSAQRELLRDTLISFGADGLDWRATIRRELSLVSPATLPGLNARAWPALKRITPAYLKIFDSPGTLPDLQQEIASAPQSLQDLIPNPKRALEEKQKLSAKLVETRSLLL
jgi:hypothetical protein